MKEPGTQPADLLRVRAAAAEDMRRVAEIENASFGDPWSEQSLRGLLRSPRAWFAVGEAGTPARVVGYIVAWFVAGEGEIANLAVDPSQRLRGVGGRLLDTALAAAIAAGTEAMYLEVRASNVAAQALYVSRGFAVWGRRRGYYRQPLEDALVLRKGVAGPLPPR